MFNFLFGNSPKAYSREAVRNPAVSYVKAMEYLKRFPTSLHGLYQEAADCLQASLKRHPGIGAESNRIPDYSNVMIQRILSKLNPEPSKILSQQSIAHADHLADHAEEIPQPARDIIAYLMWITYLAIGVSEDPATTGDTSTLRQLREILEKSLRFNDQNAAAHSDLAFIISCLMQFGVTSDSEITIALSHCDRSLQLWDKNVSAYRVMAILYLFQRNKRLAQNAFDRAKSISSNVQMGDEIQRRIRSLPD